MNTTKDLVWAAREALAGMKEADRVADEEDVHPDRDNQDKGLTPMQTIRFHLLSNMAALESALAALPTGGAAK